MSKKKNLGLSLLKIEIIINHKLPIENGRFGNIDRFRVHTLCNSNSLGDEFNYLFDCQ